jgi:hypothetical protein
MLIKNKSQSINEWENARSPIRILSALNESPQTQYEKYGKSGIGLINYGLALEEMKDEESEARKMLMERAGLGGNNQTKSSQINSSIPSNNQVQSSFDRMMNIGQVGGLGGRMGQLEQASMRLGEAASQRRIGELEKEIEAKTAGIGMEAKAAERASLESQMRDLQSKISRTPEERKKMNQISRQLAMLR